MRTSSKGAIYISVPDGCSGGHGDKEKKRHKKKKRGTQKPGDRLRYLKAQKEQEREKKMKKYTLKEVYLHVVSGDIWTLPELASQREADWKEGITSLDLWDYVSEACTSELVWQEEGKGGYGTYIVAGEEDEDIKDTMCVSVVLTEAGEAFVKRKIFEKYRDFGFLYEFEKEKLQEAFFIKALESLNSVSVSALGKGVSIELFKKSELEGHDNNLHVSLRLGLDYEVLMTCE